MIGTGIRHRKNPMGPASLLTVMLLAAACGQGDAGLNGQVDTDVVRLETNEVMTLGSEMADCLRDIAGVEVSDDFLLNETDIPFDFDNATPEQEQALVSCFNTVGGVGSEGTAGLDQSDEGDMGILQVDVQD